MGFPVRHTVLLPALLAVLVLPACSGSSSGGGASGPAGTSSAPPGSTGFTPASGTADTGELFPVYTNKEAGYSLRVPGGWRVKQGKGVDVRIGRFGDAIAIVVRERKAAPFYKGYQKQLEALLAKHDDKLLASIVQPASQFAVGKDKITKAVIEQKRPTGPGDAPVDTVITYRYLFWKDGKLVQISMSSVKGVDNGPAWDLIASSFKWN
ncbi:MAG TPA: hypothetical protein VGC71_12650 [Gaiellales bacterium]|jgi:hypothetical protein